MGEAAEDLLDGTCCQQCGEYIGDPCGYPRSCAGCGGGADDVDEGRTRYAKKPKNEAYIVWVGRKTGIYSTWAEAQPQVHGFTGARFKGYRWRSTAEKAWADGFDTYEQKRTGGRAPVKQQAVPVQHTAKRPRIPYDAQKVKARARALTTNFKGSHTVTCTTVPCNYPNCLCMGTTSNPTDEDHA